MMIAGSPSPPPRVVVVGYDHAGANIHTARARNTTRNSDCRPGRSRANRRRRRPPDSRSSTGVTAFDRVDGRGRDDLLGRRPDG
jgi:hypothetical protein